MFKLLYCKFIHDNMYKMLLELTAFLEDMTKTFWCVFFRFTVYIHLIQIIVHYML